MKHFLEKEQITILVTDSGIGGISVAQYLYYFLKNNNYYKKVNIVYADSRKNKVGYNTYQNNDEKINVFSNKLFELNDIIKPDIIFLACNTLSLILNKTDFYKKSTVPIIDIFNCSLQLMIDALRSNDMIFILGTKTTIELNYYKNRLLEYGFKDKKIINQMCPNLAKYIQASDHTQYFLNQNINWLTNRIIQKKNDDNLKKFAVSFNCTHYFYVIKRFKKQFEQLGYNDIQYICPNYNMIKPFTSMLDNINFLKTDVNFVFFDFKLSQIQKHKIKQFLNHNQFSIEFI